MKTLALDPKENWRERRDSKPLPYCVTGRRSNQLNYAYALKLKLLIYSSLS
jgi:hypothetical protein